MSFLPAQNNLNEVASSLLPKINNSNNNKKDSKGNKFAIRPNSSVNGNITTTTNTKQENNNNNKLAEQKVSGETTRQHDSLLDQSESLANNKYDIFETNSKLLQSSLNKKFLNLT